MNKLSSLFSWNKADAIKAAIMAGLAVIVSSLYQSFSQIPPVMPSMADMIVTAKLAASTAGMYLLKNLFTNSDGKFITKDTPKPIGTSNVDTFNK